MYKLIPVEVLAGVEPSTDKTVTTTRHYVYSKGIRFVDGFPEKVGGWLALDFDNSNTISGFPRSLFSYFLSGIPRQLIGTNTRLYDIQGSQLTNITPVKTATIAIANSLDTYYDTLSTDPITTVSGSTTVTIADTAHKFRAGDTATISGVSGAVNGIPDTELNADHFIRSVSTNSYTVIVNTAATSSGTGGGGSVVRTSGYITVNATAHGLGNDDRVKIQDAADTGGILAAEINLEFTIRNVDTNTFDIYTAGTATSSVSSGGGASTTYQEPIDAGAADTLLGSGYGVGLYGVGLYGVSKSSSATDPPRLWSHDRFGTLTVSAFNNDSDIYEWDGDTTAAPVKVSNSPTCNYVFVSDSILVALGYDGSAKDNGIAWSDQGDRTNWTTGQAGSDTIEGAGKFISQANARGTNLLWTQSQTYTFRYIGGQFIWQTKVLDPSVGIIGQNARVSANGNIYWMANNNFYMWRGGNVEVIPSNSSTESTVLRYVFDNLNFGQKEKCFAWYNDEFREIWFHYPSAGNSECDRIARVNIDTFVWVIDELQRSAAEYPTIINQTPYLINQSGTVYLHENGVNNDESGMEWQLTSPYVFAGTDTVEHGAFIPDMSITGTYSLTLKCRKYPQSSDQTTTTYSALDTTNDRIVTEKEARYWQIDLSGSTLNQELEIGQWYQEVKKGSPR